MRFHNLMRLITMAMRRFVPGNASPITGLLGMKPMANAGNTGSQKKTQTLSTRLANFLMANGAFKQ